MGDGLWLFWLPGFDQCFSFAEPFDHLLENDFSLALALQRLNHLNGLVHRFLGFGWLFQSHLEFAELY